MPPLTRTITLTDMVAYAGATWDWHRLHYDPAFVEAKRLPAPDRRRAGVRGAAGRAVAGLARPALASSPRSHFTFKNLVFAGETVRCEGTVTEVGADRLVVEQRVVVVGADGQVARVAVAQAGATVLLGRADGPGAADGGTA